VAPAALANAEDDPLDPAEIEPDPGCAPSAGVDDTELRIFTLWGAFLLSAVVGGWIVERRLAKLAARPAQEHEMERPRQLLVIAAGVTLFLVALAHAQHAPHEHWWARPAAVLAVLVIWLAIQWWGKLVPHLKTEAAWLAWLVALGFGAVLFACYVLVSWLLSEDWVLGWCGGFGVILLTAELTQLCSQPFDRLRQHLLLPARPEYGAEETVARHAARFWAMLAVGLYVLACVLPITRSPAVFVSLFFFASRRPGGGGHVPGAGLLRRRAALPLSFSRVVAVLHGGRPAAPG
jgi:hypothetical protein